MGKQPEILVITPQEARMDDLEGQVDELLQEFRVLPERLRQQATPPAPRPAQVEQLREWAD